LTVQSWAFDRISGAWQHPPMAAIRTMKRFDKQKEPAALIFSNTAGSKWAQRVTCSNQRLFYFPLVGAGSHHILKKRTDNHK